MLKRTTMACVALGLTIAQALAQAPGKSTFDRIVSTKVLRLGAAQAEPWYFKDTTGSNAPGAVRSGDDVWRGVGPAVGKTIADAMGAKLQIVETTYASAVAGLQSNQFDVMFVLNGTPKRALAVDFLANPLLWFPMGYYSRDPDISPKTTWKELDDPKYRIGVFLGGNSDQFANERVPHATIMRFQQEGELWAAFQANRIHGVIVPATQLSVMHAQLKMGKVINPRPFAAIPAGIAIQTEADPRWRNYLTTATSYLYSSGDIERMYEEYLAFRGVDVSDVIPVIRENW